MSSPLSVLDPDPNKVIRLSWSRLRTHDECPAKGALQREFQSPVKDIRNFVHGNVVDTAMRRWLAFDEPPPGWMLEQVDAIFEEWSHSSEGIVRWKHPGDKKETLEFCRELVKRLEPILAEYVLPFTWQPAVRFDVPMKVRHLNGSMREIRLVGEMDLLVQDHAKRTAVWDLKGTKDDGYWRKVAPQLAFYAIAVAIMTGQFPYGTGLIQPMCSQRVLPVTVTPQALREIGTRIERLARDIWAGNLAPKESNEGCAWCPVNHACPKYALPVGRGGAAPAAAA
jgi:hypothetical protein